MDEYSEFFREIKRYDDDYAQKNEQWAKYFVEKLAETQSKIHQESQLDVEYVWDGLISQAKYKCEEINSLIKVS